jgi:hypothetical protein
VVRGGEVGGESRSADELRRRIRDAKFGVLLLQCGEGAEQLVELAVGDDRRIPDVVAELVVADLLGELLPLAPDVRGDRICVG